MGNVTEVMTMAKRCYGPPIQRIDADHYVDLRTGEIFDYKHIDNRAGSLDSIRRTLAYIRALVNTNVKDAKKLLWITLTYGENMTDTKRLYKDFTLFWKKFIYWLKAQGLPIPSYLSVIEPQARGAWHIHLLLIWQEKAPFIPNDDVIASLWGQGFTKTKSVKNCDNIGAYFSAYLGDVPVDEYLEARKNGCKLHGDVVEKEITDDEGYVKKKQFIKGGRLSLYPAKMNIIRKSKGIKQPTVEDMTYAEASEKVRSAKQTFSCVYEVVNDDEVLINTICKNYYNEVRQ
jgi:hypothetical protein